MCVFRTRGMNFPNNHCICSLHGAQSVADKDPEPHVSPCFHGTQDSPPKKGYFNQLIECVESSWISHVRMYVWGILSHLNL